ncbi:MAG: hypothetical protein GXO82_01775 [Chlorobi bacterium]|nr:hypothetical protein [Chlorobiota bacterium]
MMRNTLSLRDSRSGKWGWMKDGGFQFLSTPITLVLCAVFLLSFGASLKAQDNSDCLMCHDDRGLSTRKHGRKISLYIDEKRYSTSVHADLDCISCHADLEDSDFPHTKDVQPVDCGQCHEDVETMEATSLHGRAAQRGDPLAPRCSSCHGKHYIVAVKDPRSTVAPLKIPFLCGRCHQEGAPVQRLRSIPVDHILENYSESIHGEGLLKKGLIVAPTCVSCHTPHSILPHTDPRSSISRRNIAKTCTQCHAQIEAVHRKIIKGALWEKEAHVLPACIDCHQPHKIRKVYYSQGMADQDCLNCHQKKDIVSSKNGRSLYVDPNELVHSSFGTVACSQCHSEVSVSRVRPCETITRKVDCSACHAEIGEKYKKSTHGKLAERNDPNAPTCKECHGTHKVLSRSNPISATFPTNVPRLCARCHREGQKAAVRYVGSQHEIVQHYRQSIHGKGLLRSGLTVTAMCTSCHTAHSVLPATDSSSSVNPRNIPITCGKCHHGIQEEFEKSIHATAVGKTDKPLPVCSDCHSAHTIQRADQAGFKLEIMNKCGRCHERIAKTYFDTYHGKVSQLGYTKTAKCYDCHGAHDILPVTDPRSRLSYKNVVSTCQKCHPGATRRFAGYLTHATHHDPDKYPFLFWTFWGMTGLLIGTFIIGGLHTILWLPRALKMRRELKRKIKAANQPESEDKEGELPEDSQQSESQEGDGNTAE